ncbi:MAG: hypothetical protein U0L56_09405 [Lachnospiraceae bacterium]|nr:hypothetical protein [Lachnospiraceae bacterium]
MSDKLIVNADKNKQKKWKFYERRWKFRDFYFNKCLRRHGIVKYFHREPVMPHFAHKWVMSTKKTNDYIYNLIMSNKPFMVCRFGNTELQTVVGNLRIKTIGHSEWADEYLDRWFTRLGKDSGFFPVDYKYLDKFTKLILDSCKEADLLAMWHCYMEDYVITEYNTDVDLTFLFRLEPWLANCRPWSAALKGKKVLVIHPFEDTIRAQYKKRELLFPGTDILPEFELKTLKAVQTLCGEKDERFENWFEALDYMYKEALKIDFDVAIIGCGAYGMPLAAMLKKAGKQTIHLGGATQLMFGIKGRRWEENYPSKIATCFNDAWTYPLDSEKPQNGSTVEKGCYWK